ncbi:hypothetical protein [Caulobacter sp. BP25]|uniref:hypothetical protein n=1 Tax=Caulobacter sp. BP25 TaxID=2048900 RepID=UPI00117C5B4E|nr:hypothetical protein [Caulobacter sp. BP25]
MIDAKAIAHGRRHSPAPGNLARGNQLSAQLIDLLSWIVSVQLAMTQQPADIARETVEVL